LHELAVAAELLDFLLRTAAENGGGRVTAARLRIGAGSCVSPDSLRFGFDALAAGTAAAGCRLEIERPPAAGACASCSWRGEVADLDVLACPACGWFPVTLSGGRELTVETVTVD